MYVTGLPQIPTSDTHVINLYTIKIYLLSKLTPKYRNKIGLYGHDGLAAFNEIPREIENIKKKII